jgi:hypothetical protein
MENRETLKALAGITKTLTDLQIAVTDHWVYVKALGTAVSRYKPGLGLIFQECLQAEMNNQAEARQALQTASEQLTKVIQTLEPPSMGSVN